MFVGQYRHSMDAKGRLIIPARYRELLDGGGYITSGFDGNLLVFTRSEFETISQHIFQNSLTDSNARLLMRKFFSSSEMIGADKIGRILIPQHLRQAASLNGEVVIAGNGMHFEIWDAQRWEVHEAKMMDDESNIQRFAEFKIPLTGAALANAGNGQN